MDLNVPMVKGTLLFHMKQNLRNDFGEETLNTIIARTGPESQEILNGMIISAEWYPERVIAEFAQASIDEVGKDTVARYARKIAKDQLNRLLKFLLHIFSSPEALSKNNPKLWEKLHNTGTMRIIELKEKSKKIDLTGFDFINTSYQDLFAEYHCGLLDAIGAKNARGTVRKIGVNHYHMEYSWE